VTARSQWTVALVAAAIGALLATGISYVAFGKQKRTVVAVEHQMLSGSSSDSGAGPGEAQDRAQAGAKAPTGGDTPAGESAAPSQAADLASRARPAVAALMSRQRMLGSAVVFRSDGLALTAADVVGDAETGGDVGSLTAVLADERHVGVRVLGIDSETGVAVLKLTGSNFDVATLGSSLWLRPGEGLALASYQEEGVQVPLTGVVDDVGQTAEHDNGRLENLIEVGVSADGRAAGAALLDREGAVVGILVPPSNAPGAGGVRGPWYAAPIELARQAATLLAAGHSIERSWLGIKGHDLDATTAQAMRVAGAAVIDRVEPLSPAQKCGLHAGDVVTEADGQTIISVAALRTLVELHRPGTQMSILARRDSGKRVLVARLVSRSD